MKLIRKGAEGDLFLTNWINQKAILKSRKKKDYRNASLDYRLRKQRTIRESEIISEVKKFGIPTPLIYFVDVKNCNIMMQNRTSKFDDHAVDLRLFKEILNSAHAEIFEKAWSNFLSGYKTSVGKERFAKVTNQVMVIESRGRYARVV